MNLNDLGWNPQLSEAFGPYADEDLVPGRAVRPSGATVVVETASGQVSAFLAGRLRCEAADDPTAAPAVGDWVALRPVDEDTALLEAVLPRRGALVRKGAGRTSAGQVMAAHVDRVWLAQGLDRGVNPGWLERAVALARGGGVEPVVLLTKADLGPVEEAARRAREAAPGVEVLAVSAATGQGLEALGPGAGRTAVLLGASGAGKSTLINALCGREVLATAAVREGDSKGRHTTTHRELVVLPGGGLLVDTPGIRELGLWVGDVDAAFPEIEALSTRCHYRDCTHGGEPGCAVVEAVEAGQLDARRYERFLELQRELESLEVRRDAAEQRRRGKRMARMIKEVKRERSNRRRS